MRISQLYTYPIKSIRGTPLSSATVTRTGFLYDRRFMLLKVLDDGTLENMHIPVFPEMSLFYTDIIYPSEDGTEPGHIVVTYRPAVGASIDENGKPSRILRLPLSPDTRGLDELTIVMHRSPTKGYNMGPQYNGWFSEWFGFPVVLAYLGPHSRGVLGSFAPTKSAAHTEAIKKGKPGNRKGNSKGEGVLTVGTVSGIAGVTLLFNLLVGLGATGESTRLGMSSAAVAVALLVVVLGGMAVYARVNSRREEEEHITFADTAPYLLVSATSVDNVSERLEGNLKMDVTKFRPNIVVAGANEAFEEDFWAEVVVGSDEERKTRLLLTANCIRCQSLNVDYATGAMAQGKTGNVLKKLMKDRRVDKGAKYSPVFGRYVFLDGDSEGQKVQVGDEVVVARRVEERMVYDWPGLTN
ncbi:MOSC domain protein [Aspergillus homomorphus CBS 101889]|uniref:MOSC domain-containing protein n=1 Tax=Aspergillus homomorphus (strain CBS 101889) TaxID=1450537 RepID=A0A395I4N8_ASPHC|nr:hypothetical protein BO97DRAFT_441100 [Aspergillus homomorphus CBS 101889]RAL15050.1 hypothetical protein BO97DRAFT_441100 [Aspergillus homomorphus CBS 101889]